MDSESRGESGADIEDKGENEACENAAGNNDK